MGSRTGCFSCVEAAAGVRDALVLRTRAKPRPEVRGEGEGPRRRGVPLRSPAPPGVPARSENGEKH